MQLREGSRKLTVEISKYQKDKLQYKFNNPEGAKTQINWAEDNV